MDFTWHAGLALKQKQRSIDELHRETSLKYDLHRPLEISSKSDDPVGVALSSFNLKFTTAKGLSLTVEAAFQGSKVFEEGGPYRDIFFLSPREAKRDDRLKNSGSLIGFSFFGVDWPLIPRTSFYDWLYIRSLMKNDYLYEKVITYGYFTDIEFNPDKSVNCQARSAALYLSLRYRGLLERCLEDLDFFRGIYKNHIPEPQHDAYHKVLV